MSAARIPVPLEPLELGAVLERWPTIRQSWASSYDDCPLSSWLMLRYGQGWSTTPQARGTIFHRAAAEIMRVMQATGSMTIPRQEALAILLDVCYQRDVPATEIVRVPLRQMPELRMAVDKFAKDNEFSVEKIVDVERQITAPLNYPAADGGHVERMLTGTLDVLMFAPPDEAIVIDWKDTWALPPEPKDQEETSRFDDDELAGLSFHGYFQQRWYGWLVMSAYRNVQKVTLREFYPRRTKVRKATLFRHQLPEVEQELGVLLAAFDEALMLGQPRIVKDADGLVMIEEMGRWAPQPGRHCLAGETRFLTSRGVRSLADAVEESVRVLDRHGRWRNAVIRGFGRQPLLRVEFDDGSVVRATPDHRWWTVACERGSWRQTGDRVTTVELDAAPIARHARLPSLSAEGVRHGYTFGDGYLRRDRGTAIARIMPQDAEVAEWFNAPERRANGRSAGVVSWKANGQGFVYGLPGHFKSLPQECSPSYARGFIAGLHAADGKVDRHGGVLIHCEGREKAERIAEIARLGGCVVSSVRLDSEKPTAFSPVGTVTREMMAIRLKPATAPVLKSYHRARLRRVNQMRRMYRRVVSVEFDGWDQVYCAVVPGSESFTLANGLVTSNCGFCTRPPSCPLPEDVRVAAGADESAGAATSEESAARWAARYLIADRIRTMALNAMKGYVEMGGGPIPVKWAKGRGVMGWYRTKRGRRFGFHVPDESDRGGHRDFDAQLMDAMRSATERAREERGVQPRQRRRKERV